MASTLTAWSHVHVSHDPAFRTAQGSMSPGTLKARFRDGGGRAFCQQQQGRVMLAFAQ